MHSFLSNLPSEIVERIVLLLDLNDICNLRLTSRQMAAKATQGRFRSHFRCKHVDIVSSDLRAFVDATLPGKLGREVQHITLVGVVYNTKLLEYTVKNEEKKSSNKKKRSQAQHDLDFFNQRCAELKQLHNSGMDVGLLTQAFGNIAAAGISRKPVTLSLEVVVYREDTIQRLYPASGGSWRFIWKKAAETFHTALGAATAAKLPIERLNIFNSRHLQRCSLPSFEFSLVDLESDNLAHLLANLKSLSVSFSNKFIPFSKHWAEFSQDSHDNFDWNSPDDRHYSLRAQRAEAANKNNWTNFSTFLQMCSQLEDLELHQFRLENFDRRADNLHGKLMRHVARVWNPPSSLRRVELRGVDVSEIDLLQLVTRMGVRDLSMYHISKYPGTFRAIFDLCTSDSTDMDALYIHQLTEESGHVFFDGPGSSEFWPINGPLGSDTLDRKGPAVKQPIVYCSAQDSQPSSPAVMIRMQRRKMEYGPP